MSDHHFKKTNAEFRPIVIALVLTAIFVVVEVIGALAFNSLALSADGAHSFSDTVALSIALIAQWISRRPVSYSHTYGWLRAEVIAAQLNGLLLLGVSIWIGIEAVARLSEPSQVQASGLIVVGLAGLIVNLISTALLLRSSKESLNIRGAVVHTSSDALGSLGALVAGIAIAFGAPDTADPIASLFITALVVWVASKLIFDTTHVLLEGAPRHLDSKKVEDALKSEPSVVRVHHLHLWSLTQESVALSAHIELKDIKTLHDAQTEGERLKALLAEKFGIDHSTLELECHPCEATIEVHT